MLQNRWQKNVDNFVEYVLRAKTTVAERTKQAAEDKGLMVVATECLPREVRLVLYVKRKGNLKA